MYIGVNQKRMRVNALWGYFLPFDVCIVVKRCVVEQKLLLTAYVGRRI